MECIKDRLVAYFSMEIALENSMPTYSGGLGVLAGDTIRAAADLRLPMVAVSLLYRKGYFSQRLAEDGTQTEESVEWRVEDFLHEEAPRVTIPLEDRRVELRCWRYSAIGVRGYEVPIYFLDADLPSNAPADRALTGTLYGGDPYYRLCQEVILGIGGVRMLRALGHNGLTRYHMNEGHAALLSLELLEAEAAKAGRTTIRAEDIEKVRCKCVFTTHTPVPAGHDRFPMEYLTRAFPRQTDLFDLKDASAADLVKRVLQAEQAFPDLQQAARADAGREREALVAADEWRGQNAADALRDRLELVTLIDVRHDDRELVAAQTPDELFAPQRAAQALRDFSQNLVAGTMTDGIVDRLESVDVDKQHRDADAQAFGFRDRLIELRQQRDPVR